MFVAVRTVAMRTVSVLRKARSVEGMGEEHGVTSPLLDNSCRCQGNQAFSGKFDYQVRKSPLLRDCVALQTAKCDRSQ